VMHELSFVGGAANETAQVTGDGKGASLEGNPLFPTGLCSQFREEGESRRALDPVAGALDDYAGALGCWKSA
jgi:hypothetical protein